MQRSVTLIELAVVIIIVGLLVALSLPLFGRAVESTRAKEAVAALRQIWAGERIYRTEEGFYYPPGATVSDIQTINNTLRLSLDTRASRNWDYAITAAAHPPGDTFTATATRRDGRNAGETITINQDGEIDTSNWSP